jgi:hypothetical protein
MGKQQLNKEQEKNLLQTLSARFHKFTDRHKGVKWEEVENKLKQHPNKLWSLNQMEETGGEPDVIKFDKKTGEYWFCDCVAETPKGRRSICYDKAALDARKEHKPAHSAMEMAKEMGIELLDEEQYRYLQSVVRVDTKTSSWLKTPDYIRQLDGAIFGDFRYDTVFIYHNGVQSYYGSRAFRGLLKV